MLPFSQQWQERLQYELSSQFLFTYADLLAGTGKPTAILIALSDDTDTVTQLSLYHNSDQRRLVLLCSLFFIKTKASSWQEHEAITQEITSEVCHMFSSQSLNQNYQLE